MIIVRNLFFLFSVTIFGIASVILAVFNYNPFTANIPAFINFYLSFFVALTGILAIALFYLKTNRKKSTSSNIFFWPSIRQASFFSAAITVLLALKGLKILDFLIGISVIIVVFLLELFFRTKKSLKTS